MVWDGGDTLVAVKPAGLPTQAPPGHTSLETVLRRQLATRTDYVAFPHRLDRVVGGVILVGLTKRATRLLSQQLAARKVRKEYRAIVAGHVGEGEGLWEDYLIKVSNQPVAKIVTEGAVDAKLARTRFEVAEWDRATDRTVLKLFPETGRMHQLRVQTAHRGHPIIGDTLYGGPPEEPADQIQLQAMSLVFHRPRDGRRVKVPAKSTV